MERYLQGWWMQQWRIIGSDPNLKHNLSLSLSPSLNRKRKVEKEISNPQFKGQNRDWMYCDNEQKWFPEVIILCRSFWSSSFRKPLTNKELFYTLFYTQFARDAPFLCLFLLIYAIVTINSKSKVTTFSNLDLFPPQIAFPLYLLVYVTCDRYRIWDMHWAGFVLYLLGTAQGDGD